jgi:hypothetical protein
MESPLKSMRVSMEKRKVGEGSEREEKGRGKERGTGRRERAWRTIVTQR